MTSRLKILSICILSSLGVAACTTSSPYKTRDQLVSNLSACSERRFEVYFDNDKATLTPAAVQAIQMTADMMLPCQVTKVQVTGLADARGGVSSQNQSLSEQRANSVAQALTAAGLPAPVFEVQAAGAEGATHNGINDPLRRRTEVVIQATIPR